MSEFGLIVTNLAVARGERWLFDDLSFRLAPGQALTITGPNGAGKSTLLRVLAGLLAPVAGTVVRQGSADETMLAVAYLGHHNGVKPALTVEQHLDWWLGLAEVPRTARSERTARALTALALTDLSRLPARVLSAGQKRRLALARLAATAPPLWLLDEPTTALDAASVGLFEALVADHRAAGGMAAIATHHSLRLPGALALDLAGEP